MTQNPVKNVIVKVSKRAIKSIQEEPSWNNWKIVHWGINNQQKTGYNQLDTNSRKFESNLI